MRKGTAGMTALTRKIAVYVITAWVAITVNFLLPT
jgi:hypothetical protein